MFAMKKSLILLLFILLIPAILSAENVVMTTYYPAPFGVYDRLRLNPRSSNLSEPCEEGTLYVDPNKRLQYCASDRTFEPLENYWEQYLNIATSTNYIYLKDTDPNLKVGIGTTSPQFKLHIKQDTGTDDAGIIAEGTHGSGTTVPNDASGISKTRLVWYPRKSAFRAGRSSSTQWDDGNIGNYSVALGLDNTASGINSFIGSGVNNIVSGNYSFIGGGGSLIVANGNSVASDYSTISGGENNEIITGSDYSTIAGGRGNTIHTISYYSTISGGTANRVAVNASINGGTIGGGNNNEANSHWSTIGGGQSNIAGTNGTDGDWSVVAGGAGNHATKDYTTVGGGNSNEATANAATVSGGNDNTASATYAVVSGGQNNIASGLSSTVSGGGGATLAEGNSATAQYSAVSGGYDNDISSTADYSIILGGRSNKIAPGGAVGGINSVVSGQNNQTTADYSWVGGKGLTLTNTADRTFAWGYTDGVYTISQPDSFLIFPTVPAGPGAGQVGIGTVSPTARLEVRGDIKLGDNGNLYAVGGPDNLRMIAGFVQQAGSGIGVGFSSTRLEPGHYRITFTNSFSGIPYVVVTAELFASAPRIIVTASIGLNQFDVYSYDPADIGVGPLDTRFNFIAVGPK